MEEELADAIGIADPLGMVEATVAVTLILVVLVPENKNEVVVTFGLPALEIPNWSVYW